MGTEDLFETVAAAKFMGLKAQTLRCWRSEGYGPPYIRPGRSNRSAAFYRKEDLEAFLASRTFTSTSDETERESRKTNDAVENDQTKEVHND